MPYRTIIFWSHSAAGIVIGAMILSMSITGMLLAFEPQIVNWSERHAKSVDTPGPDARRASLEGIVANARGEFPGIPPAEIRLWSDPSASISVRFGKEKGSLYLNPYTGKIIGKDSKARCFLQTVEDWHRWLTSRKMGKPVVDVVNLIFLFMLLSGLYLWYPRRWTRRALKAVLVPNPKLTGKARDWNRHNAFGFWTAPLLIVISLTGAVISYRWASDLVYVLSGNIPPPRSPEEAAGAGGKTAREGKRNSGRAPIPAPTNLAAASLDSLLAQAEGKVSPWHSINLRFPQKAGVPVVAYIQEPGFWRRFSRSQLTLNPVTADVIKWEPYSECNLGRKVRMWVVPIHTGQAGGIPGQIIAALAAFSAALLVWTGVAMSWRRFFQAKPRFLSPSMLRDTMASTCPGDRAASTPVLATKYPEAGG
ncbi:MAG TPA: PepSY-associated TM helix domain-containing protein [Fibrobacteria bacterium]|nr:PepSY-associated TM helix domain-containing protein [Fibrobacteria bacterium]